MVIEPLEFVVDTVAGRKKERRVEQTRHGDWKRKGSRDIWELKGMNLLIGGDMFRREVDARGLCFGRKFDEVNKLSCSGYVDAVIL